MEREQDRKASAGIPVDPAGTARAAAWPADVNGQDDLARFCLERDTAETKRELAWVNALSLAFLVIGFIGLRPPPISVIRRPAAAEETVPTVIEPLITTAQQVSPDSAEEEPTSERPSEEGAGVAVVADSSAVAFSVPTVGNLLVPLNMAQAPPAHPMQAAVSLSTARIEQIVSTGMSGSRPAPPYPSGSLMRREQGTVLLLMEVDESGKIASISVKDSSGYPSLDQATLEYVRRHWFFSPGQGTRLYESPIVFQLR
jgi:TonB family protein